MPTRDRRVIARWTLSGDPRGVAVSGGTIYVGLRGPQSVVAIDATAGKVLREVVLDREEIASTKDFAVMRVDPKRNRLLIAQGSDESVSILSLPDLAVIREIGLEGEAVRDVVPDPKGRYLFILGRRVHIWDADGNRQLRELGGIDPSAIAVSPDGSTLAVVGSETIAGVAATMVALVDLARLEEVRREPLQTERSIRSALFARGTGALVVLAGDWLAEKSLAPETGRAMTKDAAGMRMRFERADLVSSETICLPEKSSAQVAAIAGGTVYFAEKRCANAGTTVAAPRTVPTASIYGVDAYAVAYDEDRKALAATEAGGLLTLYRLPAPEKQ
jgi:DNA-binding beta-propeller fold protein YncE